MSLPTITIVTPSFNSERYLEATIQSLLAQNYPALEYFIIDGGSTDGTLDIIHLYEAHLAGWVSEADDGMYEALQKGFSRSNGEIMAYLNSDDLYPPWALHTVADIFNTLPDVDWITSIRPLLWNSAGLAVDSMALPGYSKTGFLRGEHLPGTGQHTLEVIQQESTFWRRSLWEAAGARFDTSLRYAGDFELWARFYQHSDLVGVRTPLGGFRIHGAQISVREAEAYSREAHEVLQRYGGRIQSPQRSLIRRWLAPVLRQRGRRLGQMLGITYPSRLCVYDPYDQSWYLREAVV